MCFLHLSHPSARTERPSEAQCHPQQSNTMGCHHVFKTSELMCAHPCCNRAPSPPALLATLLSSAPQWPPHLGVQTNTRARADHSTKAPSRTDPLITYPSSSRISRFFYQMWSKSSSKIRCSVCHSVIWPLHCSNPADVSICMSPETWALKPHSAAVFNDEQDENCS